MDVRKTAHLARLALSDEEAELYQSQLDQVIGYIDKLRELDLADIEPMAHANPVFNVVRPDVARPENECLTQDEALANAPDKTRDQFKVTQVIE